MDVFQATDCLGWPARPHRLQFANDTELPPVLLVNALHDLATGYAGAVSVHEQIPGSVLLTRNGTGHCTYSHRKESEATKIMEDYLSIPEAAGAWHGGVNLI